MAFSPSSTSTAVTPGTLSCAVPTDHNVQSPGNDGVSSLTWSPNANYLVSSNWDGGVRCWECQEQNGQVRALPKAQVNHENQSPVLCTTFSSDGSTVFSGGADKAVRMWNLGSGQSSGTPQQIGAHQAPVKSVGFLQPSSLVVSGGWDKKLMFWDARQSNPVGTLDLPERCYSMDVRGNMMVVATAGRHIWAYDVSMPTPREVVRKESPLKFQSRCLAAFPDQTGFAVGSIEGRVGIHYLQKVPDKESFAFKCHRQDSKVYSVNAICFNNTFGTFATVGSDGVINFWDKDNKQRLKGFSPLSKPIPCANFNAAGNLFAYAASYDWSKGASFQPANSTNEIYIHYTPEDEIKAKGKKGLKSR